MGKKSTPKAPDLTPLTNAQLQISQQQLAQAQQQMDLSKEQFASFMDLNKQQLQQSQDQYTQQMGLQQKALDQADAANAVAKSVADEQIKQMQQAETYAQQDRDRYTGTILPLQDQYIQAAKDYASPEKQAAAAAQALADNQTQLESQRNNQMAQLASMGVDPSQVMSSSLSSQLGVAGAAQGAMGANVARQNTIQTGYNMLGNAINMGNNLPGQALGALQAGTNAGNSASGNMGSTVNNYSNASQIGATASGIRQNSLGLASNLTGSPMSWAQLGNQSYGGASNGIMNAGNLMNQGFQNQMSAYNAKQQASSNLMSGIGSVAAIAGMAMMAEGGSVDDATLQPISADAIGSGGIMAPSATLSVRDLPVALQGPQRPVAAAAGDPTLGRAMQLGGAMMAGSQKGPYTDANLQHNWLPAVYRAEGGVMGPGGTSANSVGSPRGALPAMASRDRIHAMLAPGEYVVPADVVRQLGVQHFDKLVDKFHRPGA